VNEQNTDLERPTLLCFEIDPTVSGQASPTKTFSRFKDLHSRANPAVAKHWRARDRFATQALRPGSLAFARNDLLFTMSDNTRAHALWSMNARICFSYGRVFGWLAKT
jgi:hypothetical protein